MQLYDLLFKTNFLPNGSRERLQVRLLSLLVYLPGLAILYDAYESYRYGYTTMLYIELSAIVIILVAFFLFPRFIGLNVVSNIVLAVFTLFLFITLYIPDKNAAYSLFWLATLPIVAFYFLGKDKGVIWTVIISTILLTISIFSHLKLIEPIYDSSLIFQITFSYLAVSYILFVMESERSSYEKKLSDSLKENKLLFKEVHHRTKNNMQVIMGLLETQSFQVSDLKYKKMFQAHVDRIKAMGFVHENLYTGASVEKVDMQKYLGDILIHLQKMTRHTIITDIEYITLDVRDSMSLGLIVNEAVTNAIEHAYSVETGQIDVSLRKVGKRCELRIKDYGIGYNTEKEYHSLGTTLIEDLSSSLPHGKLEIYIDNGTEIQVYFDLTEEK